MSKHLFLKVAFACLAGLATLLGYDQYRISNPNREHAMTELTRTMQPYCIGRFLVDVPEQAKLGKLSQSIMGMGKIEVESNFNKMAYVKIAAQKEAEMRAQPHKTEGSALHEVWHPEGQDATIITYRESKYDTEQFDMLAYSLRDERLFTFHYGASNDKVQEAKNDLVRAFSLIHPRENDQIPTTAGACIEHAFVPGTGYRSERITWSFELPQYPNLRVTFSIDSTEKPDTEGLLNRVDRHRRALLIQYPDTTTATLRKAKRKVGELSGEEFVELIKADTNNPNDSFSARWESNGQAKSMTQPEAVIEMNYDFPSESQIHSLSQEQLLALWDVIVSSLRPRPNAF